MSDDEKDSHNVAKYIGFKRYVFDMLANYIMAIIMINIVAGVIID